MSWLRALLARLFAPRVNLLERHANEYGVLTLQQMRAAEGFDWQCSIRAHQDGGRPRYCWTGTGPTMNEAIKSAIEAAGGYPIGGKPMLPFAPKLGGREYDGS